MFVKVVYSSTYEQEQRIEELVSYFFDFIFPKYFPENEISHFKKIGVLKSEAYAGTLRRAYQIMTSLQVITTILEKNEPYSTDLKTEILLSKNIQLLNENGKFFPFFSHHFLQSIEENEQNEENSTVVYEEPSNQFLN